jgi:hypothetical protein
MLTTERGLVILELFMQTLMNSPVARHFGHWQLQTVRDKLVKGFQWETAVGQAVSFTGKAISNTRMDQIGGLLQTGYDRSGGQYSD